MDEFVRAAREQRPPWDRVREQRVLEETLERLDDQGAEPRRVKASGRRGWWVAAAMVGFVVLGAGLTLAYWKLAPGSERRAVAPEIAAAPVDSNSSLIRFADGSEADVYAGGRVVVKEQGAERILLDQLAGAALYRVTRNPDRRFEVVAEGLTIRVVGTRFKVTILPARWVRVEVEEGLVEVAYQAQVVRLGAGDRLQVSRESLAQLGAAPRSVSSPTPAAAPPVTKSAPEGPARPVVRRPHPVARVTPVPHPMARPSAPALPSPAVTKARQQERDWIAAAMRKVDAARRAGRYAEAAKLIRGLIAKYPHNWRVSTAAFMLARIEHARRRYGAAAKAYALYRRRSPRGPLVEDALAGEARARRAAGQTSLARKLARMYLKKYPQGTHAKAMRSVMR